MGAKVFNLAYGQNILIPGGDKFMPPMCPLNPPMTGEKCEQKLLLFSRLHKIFMHRVITFSITPEYYFLLCLAYVLIIHLKMIRTGYSPVSKLRK